MNIRSALRSLSSKHAIREGGVVLVDQGLMSICSFITGVLVARAVSKEEYGIYVLAISLMTVLQGGQRALITLPYSILTPRLPRADQRRFQGSTLILTLSLSFAITVAILLIGLSDITTQYLKNHSDFNGVSQNIVLVFVVALTPFILREHLRNTLLAGLRVWPGFFANLLASILQISLVGLLLLSDKLSLIGSFIIIGIACAISSVLMLTLSEIHIELNALRGHFADCWNAGKWYLLNSLGYAGASQSLPWLLILFSDTKSVAVFGACASVAALMAPFLRGFSAYLLPRMAHSFKDGSTKALTRLLRLSLIVLGIPYGAWLIIGSWFGNPIVTWFYSEAYGGHALLVALLVARSSIEGVSTPLTNTLLALNRPIIITMSVALGSVATIALGSVLIKYFELKGAGFAALISSIIVVACKWIAVHRIIVISRVGNGSVESS